MTTVTAVTAFLRAAAVSKTSSQSSRLSRGAGSNVKGVYLRVEIAARQYTPNPLTFGPRRTLAGWGERLCLSPLPNGECQSLGGVQGALFKGRPCWGRQPQLPGAKPPFHPVGRKGTFDTKCQKCFCVTFAESNKGRRWRGERSVDLKRTISAMVGQGSVNHNSRAFNAKNTDPERSHLNITYCQENIKAVFHEMFDEALKRYNDKQTRADRRIENYYEKIRSSKQEKPFHEIILQVGNKDDMSAEGEDGQLAAAVLDEYMRGFQERNPQLRVFSAHLHMDEATPHLHIDFVPFTTGSKRGLDTRVSLKQALAAQGFKGGTRGDTEWSQWVRSEKEQLATVMERHGIEWEDKGTHDKHLSVLDYKKEQRSKEIAQLDKVKAKKQKEVAGQEQRLKELAPAVKNMERLAAEFSADPEEVLPEPGPLESAKSYREKKAKPLWGKIVKVLRSVYRAYLDLKSKFERLQADYGREVSKNSSLSERIYEVCAERDSLKGKVRDYERVRRAIGPEQADRILEAAYQQEQAEKERKRAAKPKIRIGAR